MRAHIVDEEGWIINTINVRSLDFMPGLIDARIGGQIGDRIVDGRVIYVATPTGPGIPLPVPPEGDPPWPEPTFPEEPPVDPEPEPPVQSGN